MKYTTNEINKIIRKANKNQNFEDVDSILNCYLNQIKKANTICSFDMEFSDKTCKTIVEIGFTIFNKATNKTVSEHYIIKEQIGKYQRKNTPIDHSEMFAYGYSQIVSLNVAIEKLREAFSNSDVTLIYAGSHKKKHLVKHNFENVDFISIQNMISLARLNTRALALCSAILQLCKKEQPINNAGNDSVSALEILSHSFGKKVGVFDFYCPPIIDYSDSPLKSSAAQVRASRLTNNQLNQEVCV